ncbi:endonuclease/exonuclease/phosphatase family protein [Breoghania sp.]|uniref:endonuclease/exonuclease/phosphatase family protein n=1 Tax=Breoghania sp. TaxID=2065378 RepID=UPI0029CA0422|nr:endonuclease/exonuclease/phosphatase family protein [Breoghania sp.]
MSNSLSSWRDTRTPEPVATEMEALRSALDQTISPKREAPRNLIIGTWNLKAFASLTEDWLAGPDDSPKRDWRALWAIAEIISRFDVVAIQEIKGDLLALRTLIKTLGLDWNFLITDVTRGDKGNSERMGFLFNTKRVQLSGLAGELVIPDDWDSVLPSGALQRQFARTPYAVSFRAGSETFILVTLHVDYGGSSRGRIPELQGIAEWMADWADKTTTYGQNLIALGDFNIDRHGDDLWRAFVSTGLTVPAELHKTKRSIFARDDDALLEKYYDQIAWFEGGGRRKLNMEYVTGGGFDFVPYIYSEANITRSQLQHRISDHYPLWVEFNCRS